MKIPVYIPSEVKELALPYLEKRKRDLGPLKDALTRKDFPFISQLAHKSAGTAGGFGFTELGELAKALEIAAISGNLPATDDAFIRLKTYLEAVEISA